MMRMDDVDVDVDVDMDADMDADEDADVDVDAARVPPDASRARAPSLRPQLLRVLFGDCC